jgi:hypothetical protein
MQVRDILFVDDLVDAFLLAQANMDNPAVRGHAFNIGGSPANTISLHDLLAMIENLHGRHPQVRFGPWRPGDQRYYVSDVGKMRNTTGWSPRVSVREGVGRLNQWLCDNVVKPRKHRRKPAVLHPGKNAWVPCGTGFQPADEGDTRPNGVQCGKNPVSSRNNSSSARADKQAGENGDCPQVNRENVQSNHSTGTEDVPR